MITVYTKNRCPQCLITKKYLLNKGLEYNEVNIDENHEAKKYISDELGFSSLPVVTSDLLEAFSGFRPEELDKLI